MQERDNLDAEPTVPDGVKKTGQGQAALFGIVYLYALFAAFWIFFSDRALERFADPATIMRLATVNGLVFVAITSSLLYLLLKVWHAPTAQVAGVVESGAPLAKGGAIRAVTAADGTVWVDVAAGAYRFEVPPAAR